MKNPTFLFDLNKTAAAAAESALGKIKLEQHHIKTEAFAAAKHEKNDFHEWENFFNMNLANFENLKSRKTRATEESELSEKTKP